MSLTMNMMDKKETLMQLTDELQLNMIYMWVKQNHITRTEFEELIKWWSKKQVQEATAIARANATPHRRFKDEWGNSDWRDTGEMGG